MDFTYFYAAFNALIVGFLASFIFVLTFGRSKLRLMIIAVALALVFNGLTLIQWSYLSKMSAGFLLVDFTFIVTYSLVGCFIGILPVLGVRSILRRNRKRAE